MPPEKSTPSGARRGASARTGTSSGSGSGSGTSTGSGTSAHANANSQADAHATSQDAVNARVYQTPGVERSYRSNALLGIEVRTLLKYQPDFAGRDVLDIGVGTGRTTRYLAPLARRYEGIDYSPVMVERARAALPGVSLNVADMRELAAYEDASFDFVFAPNNVIDAVSHDDRLRALRQWRRVARPGACMAMSAHNRDYRHAFAGPRLTLSRNPVTQAALLLRLTRSIVNHRRVAPLRRIEPDYALLNDEGHDFAILHYYIDPRHQAMQLASAGFTLIEVLDQHGDPLLAGDRGEASPWLMYVARATA